MESATKIQKITKGAGNHRHTLMMVLCCLIPLVILGILWVVGVSQNILSFGILLLCPIMHFVMMKNMEHGHDIENKKEELT
jgi:hypothetical protein